MTTIRITVKNEAGREVNSINLITDIPICFDPDQERIEFNKQQRKYDDFEESVKSYPCPGISDTKEGESVECELVWQMYDDNDGYEEWTYSANPERDRNNGYITRQIYHLFQQPKELPNIDWDGISKPLDPNNYQDWHSQPKEQGKEKTAEEIAKEILYYPVTNGQSDTSIAKGVKLIEAYATQQTATKDARISELEARVKELEGALKKIRDWDGTEHQKIEIATNALKVNNDGK